MTLNTAVTGNCRLMGIMVLSSAYIRGLHPLAQTHTLTPRYSPSSGTDTHSHTQVLLLRTILYGYIEQGPSTISMSNPGDNGAPVDSVNRPAFGYILNLLCVFLLFKFYLSFNLNTCTCYALTGSLIFVMNLLIISGIKLYRKLPNCLTMTVHILHSV
jgi:hypothetical protein